MGEIVLPISRCWKFESKTGDYRRLYRDVSIQIEKGEMMLEDVTYKALKKIQKTYKNHRCILEIDRSFITSTRDVESDTSASYFRLSVTWKSFSCSRFHSLSVNGIDRHCAE